MFCETTRNINGGRKMFQVCSKLIVNTSEHHDGVIIVDLEKIVLPPFSCFLVLPIG